MRAAVLLASVAALAATCLGSSHSLSLGKSSFSWKTGRRLQTGGPGPNPACISAVNGLLACTGSWGGDDRSTPVECCGGMNDIIAHCGNGSIFDTAVFILDHVDQDVSANATVPMMSLLGGCHRAGTSLEGCQAAVAAANECSPIEECCPVYHNQVQECLGVANATDDNFGKRLKNQTAAAGCPLYSIEMCRAGVDRLSRCADEFGPENLGPCCPLFGMLEEFCDNADAFVASYVTPEQMAYFNASMTVCNQDHGGDDQQCNQAVNQTLSCVYGSGSGPQCCGTFYNLQSQCGNGNLYTLIYTLMERSGNQDHVFATYQLTNMLSMCPQPNASPENCTAATNNANSCSSGGPNPGCCGAIHYEVQQCLGFNPNVFQLATMQASEAGCSLFDDNTCGSWVHAVDRCLHSPYSTMGGCCQLLSMRPGICGSRDIYNVSGVSGDLSSIISAYSPVCSSGSGSGGSSGSGSHGPGGCDYARVIPNVYKFRNTWVTPHGDKSNGTVAYFVGSQPFYFVSSSVFTDQNRWMPAYECVGSGST